MTDISIVPENIALEVTYKTNFSIECVLLNDGEKVDISADSVRLTVRDYKEGAVKIQKTNASGEHTDPTNGKTTFDIAPADFVDVQDDETVNWVYEVRRIQPSPGDEETVHLMGDFIVKLAVGGEVSP